MFALLSMVVMFLMVAMIILVAAWGTKPRRK